ncbi:hypothetical protein K493DRAFT_333569 [Basidiobolus meristosporus CBS 931.73]|uniref:Sphingomyelin synthase-like domain-containing protein n=1 Tax=Basidiobolus meristosporus CBS 931.73 TaxID=1314790 RepID=A0A1Y1Z4X0_9FUNG|nr:hypothetical protein K493DRAFT_333569 [Basidiobolus meristosporus CBS 931.73]|eukprot:ORY05328.1 hypothetical protein K493DRAFT_333569 [Basidiobolus meristosporus CBS 931.73]
MELEPFWKLLKKYVLERWVLTRQIVILLVCIIIPWGISYYLMNVLSNYASYRSPSNRTNPVMPDAGFEVIPEMHNIGLTDAFDGITFAFLALLVLAHRTPLKIVVHALCVSFMNNIMRTTTVAITSVVDPRPSCEQVTSNFWFSFALHRCGDAIFSGHTSIFMLCAMVWVTYAPRNRIGILGIFLMIGLVIGGSLIIISNRTHYTVDVLLAIYICFGNWYAFRWFWELYVVRENRFKELNFTPAYERKLDSNRNSVMPTIRELENGQ